MRYKSFIQFLLLTITSLLIFSCGKNGTGPENEKKPRLTTQPEVLNIQPTTVDITWETDYISNSTIKYSTQSGQYTSSKKEAQKVKIHLVKLTTLQSNTDYFYIVESENTGGKTSSSEFQFTTKMTFIQLIQDSWDNYENGNYEAAINRFLEILADNPNYADAYNGLGWCYSSNSIDSLDKALDNFSTALTFQASLPGALAGRGFVNLALKKYNPAIQDLTKVLEQNSNYVFEHNSKVTANAIRLALAEANFYKQNYDSSQAQVDILAPANGLNPNDNTTWILKSTSYPSYESALLAWIEQLKTTIG